MFDWSDIDDIKQTVNEIVTLMNDKITNNEEYTKLFEM